MSTHHSKHPEPDLAMSDIAKRVRETAPSYEQFDLMYAQCKAWQTARSSKDKELIPYPYNRLQLSDPEKITCDRIPYDMIRYFVAKHHIMDSYLSIGREYYGRAIHAGGTRKEARITASYAMWAHKRNRLLYEHIAYTTYVGTLAPVIKSAL